MTKKNVDVEFDSDVGYPYHLQPDIIKMALFIHNATSEQEKIERVEFGVNKFDYKFMAHVMACLLYTSPSPRDRQKSRMPSSA